MLSIGKLGSAASAAAYYAKDDYYTGGADEAPSQWYGRGAAAAGLDGKVEPDVFAAVMDGQVPNGPTLGRMVGGERQHAPGWDLTFSAPKSVSVYAALLGEERLTEAHRAAVETAIDWVERGLETRVFDAATKRQRAETGQGAVIAAFEHDLSREQDPQLHTHCVVANMALGQDGGWRSINSRSLYQDKMLLGAVYRSALAANLSELGLKIEQTDRYGSFEIAGFDPAVKKAFSTRRGQIEERLAARGEHGGEAAARAALATRAAKTEREPGALQEEWTAKAEATDRDLRADLASARSERRQPSASAAHDAVRQAAAHLAERSSSFARRDLTKQALVFSLGRSAPSQIEQALTTAVRNGVLIGEAGDRRDALLTTPAALAAEKEVKALEQSGRDKASPLARASRVEKRLDTGRYTTGQAEAVREATLGCDRVVGIQGYAGTGKTTALRAVASLARNSGYEVIGLAPSHQAARSLAEGAGIEASTVQRFLLERGEGSLPNNPSPRLDRSVLIVDESSMLSTNQMRDVLRIAERGQAARVLLVGDTAQLQAVEAGTPFQALQQNGMRTAVLDDILRQRSSDQRGSVEASIGGDASGALSKLDGLLIETDRGAMADQAARSWLARTNEEREDTAIIVPTNALRERVNAHVREGLKAEGRLRGEATVVTAERRVALTKEERARPESYRPGDIVRFERDYKRLGISRGDKLDVLRSDPEAGTVTLAHPDGEQLIWAPRRLGAAGVSLLQERDLELMPGDRVRFTGNDPDRRYVNGDEATYVGQNGPSLLFHRGGDNFVELKPDEQALGDLDHAYAHTVHAFQGRTVNEAVIVMDSQDRNLTTKQSLYVSLSRARDSVSLITDDRDALIDRLESSSASQAQSAEAVALKALERSRPYEDAATADRDALTDEKDRSGERPDAAKDADDRRREEAESDRSGRGHPEPGSRAAREKEAEDAQRSRDHGAAQARYEKGADAAPDLAETDKSRDFGLER